MKKTLKKGDKVLVKNLSSYDAWKCKDKSFPFKATIEENIDDFEYWLISDTTGEFYSLYSDSIEPIT